MTAVCDEPGVRRPRLCYVVATEMTVSAFLAGHIRAAAERYEVSVAMNANDPAALEKQGLRATLLPVPIERRISLWRDMCALWTLYRHFYHGRFDMVHSVTPKAGLVGMLAAKLAGVPRRLHTFTGQVWVTRRGWRRALLKMADRLLAGLTTHTLVDSASQRDFLVAEGVLPAAKAQVIGQGSICGVDTARFRPNEEARCSVRGRLGIADSTTVLLFLGRLNRDKGILDLATAFAALAGRFPDLCMLLVGPDEDGLAEQVREICRTAADRLYFVGYTHEPESFMAASDIFCLPSYREGFGMAAVEAAAAGLPAVASRIYGITDSVADGQTGLLHPPGDAAAIAAAIACLLVDPDGRQAMGVQARKRVLADFSAEIISRELMVYYEKMLA